MPRETDVVHALVELADTLVEDYDVVDVLTALTDRCVNVHGVSAAGVMLARGEGAAGALWHRGTSGPIEDNGGRLKRTRRKRT